MRGQSAVVGVAVLLGITAVSLAVLTASVGVAVNEGVATADTQRVADGLGDATDPAAAGPSRTRLSFASGSVRLVPRTVRILDGAGVVARYRTSAVVFTTADRRVVALAGAVVRGTGSTARFRDPPRMTVGASAAAVGLTVVDGSGADAVTAGRDAGVVLRSNVTHRRQRLPRDTYSVAVETATPDPWARYLERRGATVARTDFDGDGVPSVVAALDEPRRLHLVVSDLHLEVTRG